MKNKNPNSITVKEAAALIGHHETTIQQGLRNGTFPIGCAVKMDSGRYSYLIPRPALMRWLETGFVEVGKWNLQAK